MKTAVLIFLGLFAGWVFRILILELRDQRRFRQQMRYFDRQWEALKAEREAQDQEDP